MATLTAETVTAGKDGLTFTDRRRGVIMREITTGQAVEEAAREAAVLNQQSGDSEVTAMVNGSNAVQKVADGVRGVVQRLELYRGDKPLAWTFLHESLEADWQAGVQAGVFTLEGPRAAAGSLARFIGPAARLQAEVAALEARCGYRENVWRASSLREQRKEPCVGTTGWAAIAQAWYALTRPREYSRACRCCQLGRESAPRHVLLPVSGRAPANGGGCAGGPLGCGPRAAAGLPQGGATPGAGAGRQVEPGALDGQGRPHPAD
jgi:hypothetical protein